jgi:hypothetical protein
MFQLYLVFDTLFSLWMLVDAIRRGRGSYWWLLVLVPFGEWIYFFQFKIHDPEFEPLRRFFHRFSKRQLSVEDLRLQLKLTPSFSNRLRLAQGLHDRGECAEARDLFEACFEQDQESKEALFGAASCHFRLGEKEQAVTQLRALIALDRVFADYSPWKMLAEALFDLGRVEEAGKVLEELTETSPRLAHRVLHADFLVQAGELERAEEQLQLALLAHKTAPKYLRRQDQKAANLAKRLLGAIARERARPAAEPMVN